MVLCRLSCQISANQREAETSVNVICGQAARLPHLPGVAHLHVNRPQVHKQIQFTSHLSVTCLGTE